MQVKERFLKGTIKIVGYTPMSAEPNNEELQLVDPIRPDLTVCSWDGIGTASKMRTPIAVAERWQKHTRFAAEFENLVKNAKAAGIIALDENEVMAVVESPEKRRRLLGDPAGGPPAGEVKQELEEPPVVTEHALDLLQPLASYEEIDIAKTGLRLRITADGARVFVVNRTDQAIIVEPGKQIAGYYKGSWVSTAALDTVDDATSVAFELKDSQSRVVLNGKYVSVGDVFKALQSPDKDPSNNKVAYHTLVEKPTDADPGAFSLTTKYKQRWKFENSPVKIEPGLPPRSSPLHCAGACALEKWRNGLTSIIWTVHWTSKGLSPVRPAVHVTRRFTVNPFTGVEL